MLNALATKLVLGVAAVALAASAVLYVRNLRQDLQHAHERATALLAVAEGQERAYQLLLVDKARADVTLAERERFHQQQAKARRGFDEATRNLLETDKTVSEWAGQRMPGSLADGLRERAAVRGDAHRARGAGGGPAPGLPSASHP